MFGVKKEILTLREQRGFSKRILDLCFLVGSALIVCVLTEGRS